MWAQAQSVAAIGGEDRWSQMVVRDWQPRSEAALRQLREFCLAQYGQAPQAQRRWLLRATPRAESAEAEGQVLPLEAGMSEAELRQRALLLPLRRGMLDVVQALGQVDQLPPWLPAALADAVAHQMVARLALAPLPPYATEPPLYRPVGPDLRKADQQLQQLQRERLAQRLGRAAIEQLQARLGADFHPRMRAYLQASAQPGFQAEPAFAASFGVSSAALFDGLLESASAVAPVVAPAAGGGAGSAVAVQVRMGGHVQDEFAAQVERDWLPLVRQAAAQFDRLVGEVLQVGLSRGAQVYVGGGVADYEQILQQDMGLRADRAELQGEISGGLSNSRGQIALKFTPKQNRVQAYELAVKTTLHELTHELQKQLDHNHAGFRPPVWIIEGTADLMAQLLAPQVRFDDAEVQALRSWRERNLSWWRSANKTGLRPEEVAEAGRQDWQQLMKGKRGPYQMAGLMSMYLQAVSGERFLAAWVEYFRLAGQRGSPTAAFHRAFGMEMNDFQADFRRWLEQQ